MTTKELHGRTQVTPGETARAGPTGAALVGSGIGGLVGGLVLLAGTQFHVPFVGSIVGLGSLPAAFAVWMGVAVVLGLVFASIAGPAINVYYRAITALTARSAQLRRLLVPLVSRSALGTTAAGVGTVYGLVAGLLVGAVLVPSMVGAPVPPGETGPILLGYGAYGLFLGLGYGLALEGDVPVPTFGFLSPAAKAAIAAPVAAGVVSGAIVYAIQPVYLVYLGLVVGAGSYASGFAIWLVLSFGFGQGFAMIAGDHAARGNPTTGYGTVYGVVLAVFVGLLAIPVLVTATTGWELAFADVKLGTLLAFVAYGLVLGSVFGNVINGWPLRPGFLVGRTQANVIASLLAGAVTGLILYGGAPVYLQFFLGEMIGASGSAAAGFVVWLGIAVLLGVGFGTAPADRLEAAEYPGTAGLKLGALYGALVALPVGMFVAPAVIEATTQWEPPNPHLSGAVLAAYVLVGVVHGVAYGALRGTGRMTPRFLQGRGIPVLGGAVAGGLLAALLAYVLSSGGVYLVILGGIVGSPSTGAGVAVMLGLALLLGVLFVPLAARAFESDPTLANGLWVGAAYGVLLLVVVGVVGVPSLTSLPVPHTNAPVASYFVFGLVFGGVYGYLRRRSLHRETAPTPTAVLSDGSRSVLFGSLFGGVVGGLVIHHGVGPVAMRYFAVVVGAGSEAAGWGVWLALAVILGSIFAVVVAPRLDGYRRLDRAEDRGTATRGDAAPGGGPRAEVGQLPSGQAEGEHHRELPGQVERSDVPERTEVPARSAESRSRGQALQPRTESESTASESPPARDGAGRPAQGFSETAPFTVSATMAGLLYGVVAAIAIGALTFPIVVNTTTEYKLPSPLLTQVSAEFFLLGFVIYGLVMGFGYGVYREF